jgi:hypothetical protein
MPASQYCSDPSRQAAQVRQESTKQPTPARSPILNVFTAGPTLNDRTDDFMTRHHGKNRAAPFVARLMNIRVADAAVSGRNERVMRADFTPLEREWLQGSLGSHRGYPWVGNIACAPCEKARFHRDHIKMLANPKRTNEAGVNQCFPRSLYRGIVELLDRDYQLDLVGR